MHFPTNREEPLMHPGPRRFVGAQSQNPAAGRRNAKNLKRFVGRNRGKSWLWLFLGTTAQRLLNTCRYPQSGSCYFKGEKILAGPLLFRFSMEAAAEGNPNEDTDC
jgi:hypothetical protein